MTPPKPECRSGYPQWQLRTILGARLDDFNEWMYGQTMTLCDGYRYNPETGLYDPSNCDVAHGAVVYPWDLRRFLAGLPID